MDVPEQFAGLDLAVALTRVGGDEGLLREIAEIFLEQCPDALSEIRTAAQSGDASALERSAHTLKGSIGNFGANAAYEAALKLETLGRSGELGSVTEALHDLELAVERLNPELSKFISG